MDRTANGAKRLGSQVLLDRKDIIVSVPTLMRVWTPRELLCRCSVKLDDGATNRFTEIFYRVNKTLDATRAHFISRKRDDISNRPTGTSVLAGIVDEAGFEIGSEFSQFLHLSIFPDLRPNLGEAWDLAEPVAEFVIGSYRDTEANLRTRMRRIIEPAGLKLRPKMFRNLRSSCQTEFERHFPTHVVSRMDGKQPWRRST